MTTRLPPERNGQFPVKNVVVRCGTCAKLLRAGAKSCSCGGDAVTVRAHA